MTVEKKNLSPFSNLMFATAAVICGIPSGTEKPAYPIELVLSALPVKPMPPPPSKGIIIIDIGHGGVTAANGAQDSGTVAYLHGPCVKKKRHKSVCAVGTTVLEVERNFVLAHLLKPELEKLGYQIILTRDTQWIKEKDRVFGTNDATPMVLARTKFGQKDDAMAQLYQKADAFISVHQNYDAGDINGSLKGPDIDYSTCGRASDREFARLIAEGANEAGQSPDAKAVPNHRGIGELNAVYHPKLKANGNLDRLTTIIEASNFANQKSLRNIMNPKALLQIAQNLAQGIDFALSNPALHKMRAAASQIIGVCDKSQNQEARADNPTPNPILADRDTQPLAQPTNNNPSSTPLPLPNDIAPVRVQRSDTIQTTPVSQPQPF